MQCLLNVGVKARDGTDISHDQDARTLGRTRRWFCFPRVLLSLASREALVRLARDGTDLSAQDARTLSRTWCSLASPRVFPSLSRSSAKRFLATHDIITDVVYK